MAPRGSNRTRSILTPEQQAELVADYLAGMRRSAMKAKYNLFPTQVYAYLRKNGVKPNRYSVGNARPPQLICAVCGTYREMPSYSPSNFWRFSPTCGTEACRSILLLRPDLRIIPIQPRRGGGTLSGMPTWAKLWETEATQEITKLDETELAALEQAFHLGSDERGADITETARKSLWGRLSRLSIAVHLRSTEPAETALQLSGEDPRRDFLRKFFGRDDDATFRLADAFDVVYLWRCNCQQQHSYVIRAVRELPAAPGDYGVCPLCSAAALEIR